MVIKRFIVAITRKARKTISGAAPQGNMELTMRKKRAKLGSGNVFADLGLPNPEQELLRARLTLS
jgi:hypothetical protein